MIRAALIAIALAACSSPRAEHNNTTSTRSSDASAPAQVRADMTAMTIERTFPDADWERAAEVVLAAWKPWFEEQKVARVAIRPLAAPSGETVELLIAVEAFGADGALLHKGRTLVARGQVVQGGGPVAATSFLAGIGFPGRPIERGLLVEILEIFGVLTVDWVQPPTLAGWPSLDDEGSALRRKRVVLDRKDGTAALTVYRPSRSANVPADARQLADRLEIKFDRDAAITMVASRENPDGTWAPMP